ncbi:MAG TPA: hypothetical protein VND94_04935 [Terriglobia bacterium]|nr:hypothetical protein [Terriglobia bacterium]
MEGVLNGAGTWIGSAILALLGLIGLDMSANATDATFYYLGLLFAGFAVLMLFRLIAIATAADEGQS